MIERYPLTWPLGWRRTPQSSRQRARFEVSFAVARDQLLEELERLGATAIIISTNVPLRRDGLPCANLRSPEDPGVAIYFKLKSGPHVLACDRWDLVKDNLRAIGLHIAAMRGIERWGVGSIEQAFTGYQALPESRAERATEHPGGDSFDCSRQDNDAHKPWWIVLKVDPNATLTQIKEAYRASARKHHPDTNGDGSQMATINRAWEEARRQKQQ